MLKKFKKKCSTFINLLAAGDFSGIFARLFGNRLINNVRALKFTYVRKKYGSFLSQYNYAWWGGYDPSTIK